MTAHASDGTSFDENDDGFYTARCVMCNWSRGPLPDVEVVADALMEHAYDEGRKFFAKPLGDLLVAIGAAADDCDLTGPQLLLLAEDATEHFAASAPRPGESQMDELRRQAAELDAASPREQT